MLALKEDAVLRCASPTLPGSFRMDVQPGGGARRKGESVVETGVASAVLRAPSSHASSMLPYKTTATLSRKHSLRSAGQTPENERT